jgi:GNAT superfamily N-acetyltransferase
MTGLARSGIGAAGAFIASKLQARRGPVSPKSGLDLAGNGAKLTDMERLAEAFILPAGPGDAAELARAHVRAWRETYRGLLPDLWLDRLSVPVQTRRWRQRLTRARDGEVVLVAEGPAGVIGYCEGVGAEVHTLYLIRDAQKVGLGRRLLVATARVLEAHGATALSLWVLDGNANARAFYVHLGACPHAHRPVTGWGGGFTETCFAWKDIGMLTGG